MGRKKSHHPQSKTWFGEEQIKPGCWVDSKQSQKTANTRWDRRISDVDWNHCMHMELYQQKSLVWTRMVFDLDRVRQFLQHINDSDVYLCSLGVTESPRRKLLALAAGYYKTANWPRVMNNDYLVETGWRGGVWYTGDLGLITEGSLPVTHFLKDTVQWFLTARYPLIRESVCADCRCAPMKLFYLSFYLL